jgi:hypothetical protein
MKSGREEEHCMNQYHDGPRSALFKPVNLEWDTSSTKLDEIGASDELMHAAPSAPDGKCTGWGIPFNIGNIATLHHDPLAVKIEPTSAKWFIFMHTSDVRPLFQSDSEKLYFPQGEGRLGEHAADYVIHYHDGTQESVPVRRRHQIGAFQRHWGENCFEAVAHRKPHPTGSFNPIEPGGWGWRQTQVIQTDRVGQWHNWLWAWQNPWPEKTIVNITLIPVSGIIILSAISAGDTSTHPLRWASRQKACLTLPEETTFDPKLDENGRYSQIQLDLGQVISANPRMVYPRSTWDETDINQVPTRSPNEILIEFSAHPEASFHLADGTQIPVSQLEFPEPQRPIRLVPSAQQKVKLRVIDSRTERPVAVKLHIHGEWGEYLPPVDRHRIINPGWFEDFSTDYLYRGRTRLDTEKPAKPLGTHSCTYIPGETILNLPQGKIYLEISKGFEIKPIRRVFEILPDTDEILIELEKVLSWRERGWVTADTHVHFLSPTTALLEGAAEGINVVNLLASQWGELMTNVGDFDGKSTWGSKEAGGEGEYLVRVGTENRQHVLGHISLLGYKGQIITPLTSGGPDESALGDPIETLLTEWARRAKQQDGLVVLPHFPYPRAEQAASIVSGNVDAVEMTSWEWSYDGIDPFSLSDWYRYLNCGYLLAAVGGTDKMSAKTAVGAVRTYAHLGPNQPFTYDHWMDAVRRAETFVTYGPLVEFTVEGNPMGSRIQMDQKGGSLDVSWKIASTTIPASRIELVVNGEIRESQAIDPWEADGHWSVKVEKSTWLALLVRGHFADKPEIIAAHTSPVMVDLEGSAMLAAADAVTILEQIEGSLAYLETVGTRADEAAYKRMRLVLTSAHRSLHNRMHLLGYDHPHSPVDLHPGHE